MVSPYALTASGRRAGPGHRPGPRAARARATRSPCSGRPTPARRGARRASGDHFVIGRPTGVRSNGSVAPVALWPRRPRSGPSASSAAGGFDVVHVHEPLAPMAAYGLVLTRAAPDGRHLPPGRGEPVGAARSSRWPQLVGRRMQVRVAVSEAARETGLRAGGGEFEVLFNGIDMDALRVGRRRSATPRAARPCCSSVATSRARACSVLLDAFATVRAAGRPVGGRATGPATEVQRRRHPESDRVQWLGALSDEEVASRLAGRRRAVRPVAARRVLRHGAARGDGGRCAVVASDIEGYREAAGRARHAGAARGRRRPGPGPRRRAGRCRRGQRTSAPEARRRPPSTPGPGRWTPWPSATSRSTARAIEAYRRA